MTTTFFQMPLKVGGIVAFQATVNCAVPKMGEGDSKGGMKGAPWLFRVYRG